MTASTQTGRDASWRERTATLVMFLGLGLGVGIWASALPILKLGLGLSDRDLSVALLALAAGSVLSTIAAGAVTPRLGTGRSTAVAAVASVLTVLTPAFAGTLGQLVLCAALIGLAWGAFDISVNGHASDIERRWSAPIMSSFHAAFSVGGLVGSVLGGSLAAAGFGLRGQMGLPLAATLAVVLAALPSLGPGARNARSQAVALALPERAASGLCVVALFCFLVEGAMADWSGVYLVTEARASGAGASSGYAAFALAMALGRLAGDPVVAALGRARVILLGSLLAALGLALAVLVPRPVPVALGFTLVGLGLANAVPVVFSAAGRFGSSPSAGVAMVATVGYAGFLGGPPLMGAIATAVGLRGAMACLIAVTVLVALVARRVEPDSPDTGR